MYFRTKDRITVEAINDVIGSREKYRDGVVKLLDELGAKSAGQFSNGSIAGFFFENDKPDGWRKPQGSGGYTWPLKRNKEAWEKINKLPQLLSLSPIAKVIGFVAQFRAGKTRGLSSLINCPACFIRSKTAYFQIDDDLAFEPPEHFVEILASEYKKANTGSTGEDATG